MLSKDEIVAFVKSTGRERLLVMKHRSTGKTSCCCRDDFVFGLSIRGEEFSQQLENLFTEWDVTGPAVTIEQFERDFESDAK